MNEGNCTDWKRKYSIWSTYRFVYGMIWKYEKKILAVGTGKILTSIGAQVMGVVIPAAVIAVLEKGGGMGQYLFSMLGLFLVSAAVYGAQSYFNGIEMLVTVFRAKHGMTMLMREVCEADYQWMERKETQENFEKGIRAMDGGEYRGMEGFVKQNTELAINVLGLIVYLCAAASLEPLIILLLLAVSLIQMGIYSLARKYEESHKDERGSLWMKQHYHESVTDNIQAGKDIRLFGLRIWLLDYYKGYTKRFKRIRTVRASDVRAQRFRMLHVSAGTYERGYGDGGVCILSRACSRFFQLVFPNFRESYYTWRSLYQYGGLPEMVR